MGAWWALSIGSHRVGHNWRNLAAAAAVKVWKEKKMVLRQCKLSFQVQFPIAFYSLEENPSSSDEYLKSASTPWRNTTRSKSLLKSSAFGTCPKVLFPFFNWNPPSGELVSRSFYRLCFSFCFLWYFCIFLSCPDMSAFFFPAKFPLHLCLNFSSLCSDHSTLQDSI